MVVQLHVHSNVSLISTAYKKKHHNFQNNSDSKSIYRAKCFFYLMFFVHFENRVFLKTEKHAKY